MNEDEFLEAMLNRNNGKKDYIKLSNEISAQAAPYFEKVGAINWLFYFLREDNDSFLHVGKTMKKIHNVGLERWGLFELLHGYKIYTEYEGIEKCLDNISKEWICLMEMKDGELIVLSNLDSRSVMISLLSM